MNGVNVFVKTSNSQASFTRTINVTVWFNVALWCCLHVTLNVKKIKGAAHKKTDEISGTCKRSLTVISQDGKRSQSRQNKNIQKPRANSLKSCGLTLTNSILRIHSHFRFIRRKLLCELFNACNHKKWVQKPLLSFSFQANSKYEYTCYVQNNSLLSK